MRIWAYADCHIGTPDTLKELEIQPDYSKCLKFIDLIKAEKPDLVISVGDFWESIWDSKEDLLRLGIWVEELRSLSDHFIAGNHDRDGEVTLKVDGVQFLHGHQWEKASDGYIERLHYKANNQDRFTVIGHTHHPQLGDNFMDVGSLTLTGTFGEIDNEIRIRNI